MNTDQWKFTLRRLAVEGGGNAAVVMHPHDAAEEAVFNLPEANDILFIEIPSDEASHEVERQARFRSELADLCTRRIVLVRDAPKALFKEILGLVGPRTRLLLAGPVIDSETTMDLDLYSTVHSKSLTLARADAGTVNAPE